jgi:hypothetical protein
VLGEEDPAGGVPAAPLAAAVPQLRLLVSLDQSASVRPRPPLSPQCDADAAQAPFFEGVFELLAARCGPAGRATFASLQAALAAAMQ